MVWPPLKSTNWGSQADGWPLPKLTVRRCQTTLEWFTFFSYFLFQNHKKGQMWSVVFAAIETSFKSDHKQQLEKDQRKGRETEVILGWKEKISSTRQEKSPFNDVDGFEISSTEGEEKSSFKSKTTSVKTHHPPLIKDTAKIVFVVQQRNPLLDRAPLQIPYLQPSLLSSPPTPPPPCWRTTPIKAELYVYWRKLHKPDVIETLFDHNYPTHSSLSIHTIRRSYTHWR